MTDPTTMPLASAFAGPLPAVRSEPPSVYDGAAGLPAQSVEAECLERMARGGPAALSSPELLGLLGVRVDALGLAAGGGACAGSATTPATRCATPRSRARGSAPRAGHPRSPRPLDGGAAAPRRLPRPPRRHPALRRGAAARLPGRGLRRPLPRQPPPRHRVRAPLPLAPSTARTSIRARSCAGCWCTTPPRSSSSTTIPPGSPSRAAPTAASPGGLEKALGTVDVRVLDHLVVGDGETVSFAEQGWL